RDISIAKRAAEALQASEERYRRIVDTTNVAMWLIDAQNLTTYVKPRMAEMLACSVEEIVGRSVLDFLDAEERASFADNQPSRVKGVSAQREVRFTRKDGADLWTLLSIRPNFDEAGHYEGSLAMAMDITERRRAQKA